MKLHTVPTMHFVALDEALILLVDSVGSSSESPNVVIEIPAQVLIKYSGHEVKLFIIVFLHEKRERWRGDVSDFGSLIQEGHKTLGFFFLFCDVRVGLNTQVRKRFSSLETGAVDIRWLKPKAHFIDLKAIHLFGCHCQEYQNVRKIHSVCYEKLQHFFSLTQDTCFRPAEQVLFHQYFMYNLLIILFEFFF